MGEIKLYSSSECTRCALIATMLDAHNVPYDKFTNCKDLALEKGIEEYPTIEVNGIIIEGYSRVLSWIQDNGWYSFGGNDGNESN